MEKYEDESLSDQQYQRDICPYCSTKMMPSGGCFFCWCGFDRCG